MTFVTESDKSDLKRVFESLFFLLASSHFFSKSLTRFDTRLDNYKTQTMSRGFSERQLKNKLKLNSRPMIGKLKISAKIEKMSKNNAKKIRKIERTEKPKIEKKTNT